MTLKELKQIAASVGKIQGWDFSNVRDGRDPVPWDYLTLVRNYLTSSSRVLDIGTGGGEKFLTLAPNFGKGIGIDISDEMIQTAHENQSKMQINNVSFNVMSADALQLSDSNFDIVLNRHSVVNIDEVLRVLRTGGYFITQSVGYRNTSNILAAFGWTSNSFGKDWWSPAKELAKTFRQRGNRIIALMEYDVAYWFCDVASLLLWLHTVPLPEKFEIGKHWQCINQILEKYTTQRGIETNEHRELLIVQKST